MESHKLELFLLTLVAVVVVIPIYDAYIAPKFNLPA